MSRNQEQNHKANVGGETYVSMYDKALNQYRSQKGVCKTNQESVNRSVAVFCLALVVCLVSEKIHVYNHEAKSAGEVWSWCCVVSFGLFSRLLNWLPYMEQR
jgi:hypothetical protein